MSIQKVSGEEKAVALVTRECAQLWLILESQGCST